MKTTRTRLLLVLGSIAPLLGACGTDEAGDAAGAGGQTSSGGGTSTGGASSGGSANTGGASSGGSANTGGTTSAGGASGMAGAAAGGAGGGAPAASLCEKYGGSAAVDGVVRNQIIGEIAADCRISPFFTTLSEAAFTRVADCLSLQVQELFGCEGVTYAGARASNDLPCRSMAEAHAGLGISQGDFDALITDVVAGLSAAGVEDADIQAAAPALLGMQGDIVEVEDEEPTRAGCGGAGGAP